MNRLQPDKSSPIPVFIQIKNMLAREIRNGKFKPQEALPNVSRLAEMAGVSIRTADMALLELISDGICFRRPKKGTFVAPEYSTKRAACGIWSNFDFSDPSANPLPFQLYSGIKKSAAENEFDIVLVSGDPAETIRRYGRSKEFDFKGIITFDATNFNETVKLARAFPDKRFVFLNYFMDDFKAMPPNMTAIVNDDFNGAYALAEYLIAGCRDCSGIVILSLELPPGDNTYSERENGFRKAAEDYSVPIVRRECLRRDNTSLRTQSETAFFALKKIFRSGCKPDVILAVNDFLARGARAAISDAGIDDAIAVAGFDHLVLGLAEDWNFPTMHVPYEKMGKMGGDMLATGLSANEKVIKIPSNFITNVKRSIVNV